MFRCFGCVSIHHPSMRHYESQCLASLEAGKEEKTSNQNYLIDDPVTLLALIVDDLGVRR